jgi:hypothetical protein
VHDDRRSQVLCSPPVQMTSSAGLGRQHPP